MRVCRSCCRSKTDHITPLKEKYHQHICQLALDFKISQIFDFHTAGKIAKNGRENQVRDLLLCSESWLNRNFIDVWLVFFSNFHFLKTYWIFDTKIGNMTWKEKPYAKVLLEFGFSVKSYTDFLNSQLPTRFLTSFRKGPKLDPLCSVKLQSPRPVAGPPICLLISVLC